MKYILLLFALLLILQRYEFSSKSQPPRIDAPKLNCCCWYYKGTNFQANHNRGACVTPCARLLLILQRYEFSSKSQLDTCRELWQYGCCWYYKGTNFQANHNRLHFEMHHPSVVADTTKVRIFKQITTKNVLQVMTNMLLLILQRYEFSSKSQLPLINCFEYNGCCWYYKGTNFQANHNEVPTPEIDALVVADTTKVRIFKQITTEGQKELLTAQLLLILQRYEFSSKSQLWWWQVVLRCSCCWYYKGTNFQANHNTFVEVGFKTLVVADTTKVRIFKQITTKS